jgi:hypothetical protein
MINILIALLSGTFTVVMEEKEKHYYSEVCNLIQDYETLMFWNKHKTENKHILFALPHVEPDRSNISRKLKDMEQSIEKRIQQSESKVQTQIDGLKADIAGRFD